MLNFQYHNSLGGAPLHTRSIDAGSAYVLLDIEGQPVWQWNARGTVQRTTYDTLGRPLTRSEQCEGTLARVREHLIYGEQASAFTPASDEKVGCAKHFNLRGQIARHYDTAGLIDHTLQGHGIQGALLQQDRRLLAMKADAGVDSSDWVGANVEKRRLALEAGPAYTTIWQSDALGKPLLQIDAAGHQQRYAYDCVGRLAATWVRLKASRAEEPVLRALRYSASGKRQCEVTGNGVVTEYAYEVHTQRLMGVKTARDRAVAGRGKTTRLQDLHYEYDPVGNITAILDRTQTVRFFNNQKVVPEKRYGYDALYQLIYATGCENAASAGTVGRETDAPEVSVSFDPTNLSTYTRTYDYDRGGNLIRIRHHAADSRASFTRELTVSSSSNHAVRQRAGVGAKQVRGHFDACGNQQGLETGQILRWNGLNQLQRVATIARVGSDGRGSDLADAATHDQESYLYGGDGMRVRKTQTAQAQVIQQHDVIYLPGLELRTTRSGEKIQEKLQVLTIGQAGRAQVRILNWEIGQPQDIDNRQLRYSLDDHLGSSQLELDADANILSQEAYYPYGGTAVRTTKSQREAKYKTVRYSGKERDTSGLYYYGFRYYQPWLGRWLSTDPAGAIDGFNLYRMVRNNPMNLTDVNGLAPATITFPKNHQDRPQKVGYLYLPFESGNLHGGVLKINIKRALQGKTPYEIIVKDDKQKKMYEAQVVPIIKLFTNTPEYKSFNTTESAEFKNALQSIASTPIHIAKDKLRTLDNASKIYLYGHGSAGSPTLSSNPSSVGQPPADRLSTEQLVKQLQDFGLPKDYIDIRSVSCSGSNSKSSGSYPNIVTQPSFGQSLLNAFKATGFTSAAVSAYPHAGWPTHGIYDARGRLSLRISEPAAHALASDMTQKLSDDLLKEARRASNVRMVYR